MSRHASLDNSTSGSGNRHVGKIRDAFFIEQADNIGIRRLARRNISDFEVTQTEPLLARVRLDLPDPRPLGALIERLRRPFGLDEDGSPGGRIPQDDVDVRPGGAAGEVHLDELLEIVHLIRCAVQDGPGRDQLVQPAVRKVDVRVIELVDDLPKAVRIRDVPIASARLQSSSICTGIHSHLSLCSRQNR